MFVTIHFSFNTSTHLFLSLSFSRAYFIFTHFLSQIFPRICPRHELHSCSPHSIAHSVPIPYLSRSMRFIWTWLSVAELSGILDMENGAVQNGVCSFESVNGGCDVWSCKDSDSSTASHLVVMVNGILGRSGSNSCFHSCLILIFQIFRIYNFTWTCCFWFWICLMIA